LSETAWTGRPGGPQYRHVVETPVPRPAALWVGARGLQAHVSPQLLPDSAGKQPLGDPLCRDSQAARARTHPAATPGDVGQETEGTGTDSGEDGHRFVTLEPVSVVHGATFRRWIWFARRAATMEEIMDVLKICVAEGVQAANLGVPILAEELEHTQKT